MELTEEEVEAFLDELVAQQEPLEQAPPWGAYDYPLACRQLRSSDAKHLYPVMKRSAKMLNGFIDWAQYAPSWDFKTVQKFVDDHVNSPYPRFHLIFTIGKQVVGFGSLAPMPNPRHIQVALWVALGYQRQGIGHWIIKMLEFYAFNVYGYDKVFYQHDANNRKSGRLAQSSEYRFSHTFDEEIHAKEESGFWFSWVKDRPEGLPPGYIDTDDFGSWHKHQFPWKCLI